MSSSLQLLDQDETIKSLENQKEQLFDKAVRKIESLPKQDTELILKLLNNIQNQLSISGELAETTLTTVKTIEQTTEKIHSDVGDVGGNVKSGFKEMSEKISNINANTINCSSSISNMLICIYKFLKIMGIIMYYCMYFANSIRPSNLAKKIPIMYVNSALSYMFLLLEVGQLLIWLETLTVMFHLHPDTFKEIISGAVELFCNIIIKLFNTLKPAIEIYGEYARHIANRPSTTEVYNSIKQPGILLLQSFKTEITNGAVKAIQDSSKDIATGAVSAVVENVGNIGANIGANAYDTVENVIGTDAINIVAKNSRNIFNFIVTEIMRLDITHFNLKNINGGTKSNRMSKNKKNKKGGGEEETLQIIAINNPNIKISDLQPILNQCILLMNMAYVIMPLILIGPIKHTMLTKEITGGKRKKRTTHKRRLRRHKISLRRKNNNRKKL